MAQVASKFDDASASLNKILSDLLVEVDAVSNEWVGRGGASFQQVSQAWGVDQGRLVAALSDTATAIRTAGRSYLATDDSVADRLRAPGYDLPL
jgi:WXG100 family type VII secretion target